MPPRGAKNPADGLIFLDQEEKHRYAHSAFRDRLMVGLQPLELRILVRIQVPEPMNFPAASCGESSSMRIKNPAAEPTGYESTHDPKTQQRSFNCTS